VVGYNLFLGIFDKSAISQVCEQVLPKPETASSSASAFEEEARTDLEGMTCFAKLPLDKAGHPIIDSISISTAPWALGQTLTRGLHSLSYDAFDEARQNLILLLRNFMSQRGPFAGHGLEATEVLTLQSLLCEWANFSPPATQPIAMLTAKVKTRESAKPVEKSMPQTVSIDDDDEEEEEVLEELAILNSFYIRDIERAIQGVLSGNVPLALEQYLIPLAAEKRIDLYSEKGCAVLLQALRPRFLNPGHWLAAPDQSMSLMQQFALNQIREDLKDGGLFAVNGPPGTGKTTLLRDLFADNIVQRTRVLAGLEKADDAFVKETSFVRFKGDSGAVKLRPLIDALTGFEMVVTSTNNAAVENISIDLVKRKALNKPWQSATYLQPVAHNIAVQEGKRVATSPVGDQMPWGLISCALGNSRNRSRFNERFSMFTLETRNDEKALRIWDWLKEPNAQTFIQAREAFKKVDQAVCETLAERERLAELLDIFSQGTEADFLAQVAALVEQANSTVSGLEASQVMQRKDQESAKQALEQLGEEQRLIDRTAPGWWARLWRTREAKAYAERRKVNAQSQLDAHEKIKVLNSEATALTQDLQKATESARISEQQLEGLQAEWQGWVDERDQLQIRLGIPRLPVNPLELMSDEQFQIKGLWHDEQLDLLRSELFASALILQQAWVHETAQKGGALSRNLVAISKLLSNKTPEDPSHALQIWQNLFMVVPVVSTTFASFANQFRGIGPGSLGWVFIDEAGQAVPQAAVGALWRARRCVVVGDPLQIEPVFTLPTPLINALGQLNPVTANSAYAPHTVSVQRLADQANRFGAYAPFMDEMLWVGSPLRVHRRCHDPMFTLANRIAYDNKMVYGLPERNPAALPLIDLPSGWVDIRGAVEHKQAVPEQIEFMIKVIVRLFQRDKVLPALYVISPFKAIRLALREHIMDHTWKHPAPKRDELKRWVKCSIGTVHTFQGKEEKTVFMVLGTDPENDGGAKWASSKPNLLNVALTRAQHHVYLVGDIELWGKLPYFEKTAIGESAMPCWKRKDFGVITQKAEA
jgi:ABC-type cobalamin/Fe3+-siderophores transport system ATPase subunit